MENRRQAQEIVELVLLRHSKWIDLEQVWTRTTIKTNARSSISATPAKVYVHNSVKHLKLVRLFAGNSKQETSTWVL